MAVQRRAQPILSGTAGNGASGTQQQDFFPFLFCQQNQPSPSDSSYQILYFWKRGTRKLFAFSKKICYTEYCRLQAAVAEQADARDLKSLGRNTVPVRSRSAAPKIDKYRQGLVDFSFSRFTFHSSLNLLGRFLEVKR